jgi:3'(2'), 5'-bisphosphate nucleotidase
MDIDALIERAIRASLDGGREILKVYESEFAVETKEDRSPLTLADKNAHLAIEAILKNTGLPILSEEGKEMSYEERSSWGPFWMVDPLDGTKEFVKRNGEFTVNIALIEDGVPIAGVIYVPVTKDLYFKASAGSYKVASVETSHAEQIAGLIDLGSSLPMPKSGNSFKVVGSRSHMSPETEQFLEELKKQHDEIEIVSMGSSLKICLVAEGAADVYPRFAPTMEWDTAAGHAIALGAGKTVTDKSTGEAMRYNKENLLNNWFIVR